MQPRSSAHGLAKPRAQAQSTPHLPSKAVGARHRQQEGSKHTAMHKAHCSIPESAPLLPHMLRVSLPLRSTSHTTSTAKSSLLQTRLSLLQTPPRHLVLFSLGHTRSPPQEAPGSLGARFWNRPTRTQGREAPPGHARGARSLVKHVPSVSSCTPLIIYHSSSTLRCADGAPSWSQQLSTEGFHTAPSRMPAG